MEAVVTITETGCRRVEGCGCEVEGIAGRDGTLYWVPVVACPEHCGCVGCQRLRHYQAWGVMP